LFADPRVIGAMALCFGLFVVGLTWGWPGTGWPSDELDPPQVIAAWHRHFSGGWHDKYPPVLFYLLALVYSPVLAAEYFHRASAVPGPVQDLLYLSGRALSVMLSMGTLAAVGLLSARLGYRRESWLAILLAGAFLPMAFYAKTANVEAAYLFWFALSLVLLAGARPSSRAGTFIGIGATAALAVATKDQAYALYVLPAAYLIARCVRGGPHALRPAQLAVAAFSAVAVWAVVMNVVFNPDGVREHVRTILGPASADYRSFEASAAGQVQLFLATARQIWECLAWSGLVAIALGLKAGSWRQLPPWLWLTIPSSYLCFAAIVGYSYDRFLLPLTLVCAIPAAVGIAALLREGAGPRWRRVFGWFLLAWLVMRPVGLDVLMVTDARYKAEAWLRQHVRDGETVGSFGQLQTLTRMEGFTHFDIRPGIEDTLQAHPDYIVVNTEHMQRYASDPVRMAWLAWLQSEAGPYREVFRHKSPVPWYSPLRLDGRFTDRAEAPFTNLDKVNPEIAIFQRQ
jgi:hypothetical protein